VSSLFLSLGQLADVQGVGLGFGPDVTRRWCELNRITAVIRSHEVRAEGYAIEHDGLCITTFVSPPREMQGAKDQKLMPRSHVR
jgi:hypothetical protein